MRFRGVPKNSQAKMLAILFGFSEKIDRGKDLKKSKYVPFLVIVLQGFKEIPKILGILIAVKNKIE